MRSTEGMTPQEVIDATATIDEIMDIYAPVSPSPRAIRNAVNAGKLNVIYPGGRGPNKLGAGKKMRVWKDEIQKWWFGVAPK